MTKTLQNFRLCSSGVDVAALREEIAGNAAMWLVDISRQNMFAVQRDTESIFLRTANTSAYPADTRKEEMVESRATDISLSFPRCMAFLDQFSNDERGQLQRAMIVRLRGHGKVYPHVDDGSYYVGRDRYHLVIDSPVGNIMTCGDETVTMQTGEVWWFDNKKVHSSSNDSPDWRTHIIFDLLR